MSRFRSIHPLFFAVYPAAALLANNLGQIDPVEAVRSVLVVVAGAAALVVLLRLAVRDWPRAALITSMALLVFFSYGHVYGLLKSVSVGGVILGRHRYLVPLALAGMAAWSWWAVRRVRETGTVGTLFNVAGAAALLFPAFSIGAYYLVAPRAAARPDLAAASPASQAQAGTPSSGAQPDIYYIILDGYGREEVLQDLYNCDNLGFLASLEQQGFYIAGGGRSNYLMTVLSLASSLNLQYLDDVAAVMGTGSDDQRPLADMVRHSTLRGFLAERGYRMVAFESGWPLTEVADADVYLTSDSAARSSFYLLGPPNEFEILLLRSTIIRSVLDKAQASVRTVDSPLEAPFGRHRSRILFVTDTLADIPGWQGDYFVFVHLVIPHPPFVFGPNGEPILHDREYSLSDGSAFEGTRAEYIAGYCGQVNYLDTLIDRVVKRLIEGSETPPVIILQGDHGPRASMDWHDPGRTNMREAFGILNAYYFMGMRDPPLYPSVTPVNTFLILLDLQFGQSYGLLPDESYYTESDRPYDFLRMTDRAVTDGG